MYPRKKVNVLTEIEMDVYESVVVPHKKTKSFARLIATLLRGYMENDYVKAYAEGTLDEVEAESVNVLDDIISDMQGSLASMGIFTSELKNTTQAGVEAFSSKSFRREGFLEHPFQQQEVEQPVQQSSVPEDLKGTVEELKSQNKEIMSLLEKLLEGGVQTVKTPVEVVYKKEEIKPKSPSFGSADSTPVSDAPLPKLVEVDSEEDTSGSSNSNDSNDVLSQLLSGNMLSFK